MKIIPSFTIAILLCTLSCKTKKELVHKNTIEVQGHRGDRGSFPENSIPAFISALKKGVDVIELDVVISKDNKVVVSHEPYMSSQYVTTPQGKSIEKKVEKNFNLYMMTYDSIKKFDIGSKGNSLFPYQKKMKAYKPLLSEVIDSVESYVVLHKLKPIRYNIEIKSSEGEYTKSQPQPAIFIDLVMAVIKDKNISERINIQSFDPGPLNILKKKYPSVKTAFLTNKPGIKKNLNHLDFTPDIYSPYYKLVNADFCDSLKQLKIKIIPWTVNEESDIISSLNYDIDGIISDYPERIINKTR